MRMNHARRGNTIVVALGVFTFAAVMVATAVDSSVVTSRIAGSGAVHQRALAALDAVLARREVEVIERASQGDPVEIARWNTNYGVDFVGDAEVRWKIEPVRTPPRDASGNPVHHITNPSPDANWTVPTSAPVDSATGEPYWQANDTNFMYRVAGEARIGVDLNAGTGVNQAGQTVERPAVVVQGARYTSVLKEPLFRYVIFYAARGAKGDLELSHADNVTIQGSVHTNGALYVGSGLKANDKVARIGPLSGTLAPAFTRIGPDVDNKPVRVNGVDGIFRLSKPLMYSIINGFPLYDNSAPGIHGDPNSSTGPVAVTWAADDSYDLATPASAIPIALDPPGSTLTDIASATDNGRRVNPYRIRDGSGAITENFMGNTDNLRTINGVALRGVPYGAATTGTDIANDARDLQRPMDQRWNVLSPQGSAPGFDGKARTKTTGQHVKSLPERMRNRGLEAQRLEYADNDGDDATDEHEYARPMFTRADGSITADYPRAALAGFPTFDGNAVVEEPGQYLRYAMGDGAYMVRYQDGSGWYIRTRDGARLDDPATAGLIIRERPAPSVDHWPGSETVSPVSPGDLRWIPYAYGKHWYPSRFPFTVADIADEVAPDVSVSGLNPWLSWYSAQRDPLHANKINTSPANRVVAYSPGGTVRITAACSASSDKINIADALNGADNVYRRKPYYYAQNWRFVNLGKAEANMSAPGMLATVFRDRIDLPDRTPVAASMAHHSLVGGPVDAVNNAAGLVAADVAVTSPVLSGLPVAVDRSVRFVGYIVPNSSGTYDFQANATNCKARIWVGDELRWSNWGAFVSKPLEMASGKALPIQVDVVCTGSSPALSVQWRPFGGTWASLTTGATLYRPNGHPGFERASFRSAVVRLDTSTLGSNPPQAKIGLMIRDGSGRMSPLLNGASQYGFIGYSPARGVFVERQAMRHMLDSRTQGTFYVGNGQHSAANASAPCNANGELVENSNTVSGVKRTATLTEVIPRAASTSLPASAWYPHAQSQGVDYVDKVPLTPIASLTTYGGSLSKDVGGGKIWTLDTAPKYGPRKYQRTGTPWRRSFARNSHLQTLCVGINNPYSPSALFVPRDPANYATQWDVNKYLDLFTASTGTGGYTTNNAEGNIRYALAHAPLGSAAPGWGSWPAGSTGSYTNQGYQTDWYFYGNTGEQVPYPRLRRTYGNFSQNENIAYGVPQDTPLVTFGGSLTIWNLGSIKINKAGTVSNATLSDVQTVCGLSFTSPPSVSPPTLASPAYPAYPPYPATPSVAARALPDFATPRYFQVQRAGSTVWFDLNGWITRSGTWFATAVAQHLPTLGATWLTSWPGNTPTTWPVTRSFRPDIWTGSSGPAHSTTAMNPNNPSTALGQSVRNPTTPWRMTDDIAVSAPQSIWLRIESATGSSATFAYSLDGTSWTTITNPVTGTVASLDISGWGSHLLVGPAVQSGDVQNPASATFSQMSVRTTTETVDATDWDTDSSGEDVMGRYLASQYQVWWGTREITEDFFTWTDPATGRRNASEDWIWNTREFWSQSRWWDIRRTNGSPHMTPSNLVEKDPVTSAAENFTKTRLREAFAKTTLLTLDMEVLQNYLRTRRLSEAAADRLPGTMDSSPLGTDGILRERFSGLIYAVRTNRYPWNPNINPWFKDERLADTADPSGINPWSPHWLSPLPNSRSDMGFADAEIGNDASLRSPPAPPQGTYDWLQSTPGHKLQPYLATDLKEDLPIKPQQFHHGIRLVNAARFNWGFDGVATPASTRTIGGKTAYDWSMSPIPKFGVSKTSIVTPNALYVQGNFNVDRYLTHRGGTDAYRFTPVALMADSVNLLSNNWLDTNAQIPGLVVSNVGGPLSVSGAGTLATMSSQGSPAANTEYNAAIATHNQPSTRDRVAEGQTAGFVDTLLLMENWNGRSLKFLGSLVVMDSRRYTASFLHDCFKTYGQTPFGFVDNDGQWRTVMNSFIYRRADRDGTIQTFKTGLYGYTVPAPHWAGHSPAILSEANRTYEFNYDLLTEEGTPPFAPFGVSTSGVGGWARIIK